MQMVKDFIASQKDIRVRPDVYIHMMIAKSCYSTWASTFIDLSKGEPAHVKEMKNGEWQQVAIKREDVARQTIESLPGFDVNPLSPDGDEDNSSRIYAEEMLTSSDSVKSIITCARMANAARAILGTKPHSCLEEYYQYLAEDLVKGCAFQNMNHKIEAEWAGK